MFGWVRATILLGLWLGGAGLAQTVLNTQNGHYYRLVTHSTGLAWTEAVSLATATTFNGVAGHLATITSAAEAAWINANMGIASGPSYIWLGGSEQGGRWAWVTGEPWSYVNWSGGEPNNTGNEDYPHFAHFSAGWDLPRSR